jgi:glycosyltransferase involved in cell wall biosynthesis
MKIALNAHLLTRQAGYRAAGIHGYILSLLGHLPQAAPQAWQFTALVGAGVSPDIAGMTLRQSRFDTHHPLRRIVWEQVVQPFELGGFDVYHALAFVGPLLLNRPAVVTVHDLSFMYYPQVLSAARRLYLRMLTPLTCRRAARVIAVSRSTARDVEQAFGVSASNIDVVLNGYDSERFRALPADQVEAFRRRMGLPERFWLFVGTIEPRKNLATLLEAYARLPSDARLPLVLGGGKGWMYDEVFALIERHQLKDVVWTPGFLSSQDLPFWYNSAEVFIYPSVYEGFGLPVVEAMACGTPALISDASSLPEVGGEAAMLVPPRDIEAWTAALHRVYHDADWRAQARALGFAQAARFSWHQAALQTLESYQRAQQSRHP